MNFLTSVVSSMPLRWWVALIISALGIAAICLRVLETDGVRAKRAERNKKKELRWLAQRISSYGRTVHQRYPTGDVIVSERDSGGTSSGSARTPVTTALHLPVGRTEESKGLRSTGIGN